VARQAPLRASSSAQPEVGRLGFFSAGAVLALLIGGAWTYLAYADLSARHAYLGMSMCVTPQVFDWNSADFTLMVFMWVVMMAAMMLPSILPVVVYINRYGAPLYAIGFVGGYGAAWIGFSLGATLVQWTLLRAALMSPATQSVTLPLSAALLAVAGLYQFTPWKRTCLLRCRSPWASILNAPGTTTAIADGLRYGAFCVGCCWALMALMFAVGIMNLLWTVLIAGYVIAEKSVPRADWFGRVTGVLLCMGAIAAMGYSTL
jgi:predicted metal-binding membrane protein